MILRISTVIITAVLSSACAGTVGRPDYMRQVLTERYVGKEVDVAVTDLGAPSAVTRLDSGRKVYTWQRQTEKYKTNLVIKSNERCVITMLTGTDGKLIEKTGEVDDSLGAWQISYCAEKYNL